MRQNALAAHSRASDLYLASHSSVFGTGGGVSVINQLSDAFHTRGISTLRLGVGGGSSEYDADNGQRRLNLPGAVPNLHWRWRNWAMPKRLAYELRDLPPPRGAFVGLNPLWILAARKAWPDTPIVYLFVASLTNCIPFSWAPKGPGLWPRLDHAILSRAERNALEYADRVIAPTLQSRDELVKLLPSAAPRISVCTYGNIPRRVDEIGGQAIRDELGIDKRDMLALAIGVCDRNKGFDLAIREIAKTHERVRLVVIGDGPMHEALATQIRDNHLENRVFLKKPQPDLTPWYSAADCVISSSNYDTFPYVILDGMSFGRPVLVPRHAPPRVYSGLTEILRENGGGGLYDRTQSGALATALDCLARDDEARKLIGHKARDAARRLFAWERCMDLILESASQLDHDQRGKSEIVERESVCV